MIYKRKQKSSAEGICGFWGTVLGNNRSIGQTQRSKKKGVRFCRMVNVGIEAKKKGSKEVRDGKVKFTWAG